MIDRDTTDRQLWLSAPFDQAWRDRDPFAEIRALGGDVFRDMPGRRTLRFNAFGGSWFLKHHTGIGRQAWWAERLKGRQPVTGADNEWRAIRALREAGIDTLEVAAFGRRGDDPACAESFLITADLEYTAGEALVDLETLCAGWVQRPPPPRFKRGMVRSLAEISRRLHDAGITHRDYYLCHFLVPVSQLPGAGQRETDADRPLKPVLIDLHRALLQPRNLHRWVDKDLAGLLFSARHAGLTSRDVWRFIKAYTGLTVRQAWHTGRPRWRRIEQRAEAMWHREQRRQQRVRSELLLPPPDGLATRWRQADEAGRDRIIRDLCVAVQHCHERGWLPVDRALRDIREVDGLPVVELTGAARVDATLAPDHARRANLADFLSWFPDALDRTLDDPEQSPVPDSARRDGEVPALVRAARVARWQRIAPALYRNTEQVRRRHRPGHVILHKRRLVSADWQSFMDDPDGWMERGQMIKDGDTTTVVRLTLGGQGCIVKRYNLVSTAHAIKRALQPSRAWRHWYHAHRLLTLGAWTPEPLLVMERRWGPLRRQAWLVTEFVEGRNLLQDVGTLDEPEKRQRVLAQFRDWFVFMRRHRVNHGDMKISNFISRPGGLLVLDLDGMRWPGGQRRFERGFRRDVSRFMRNWRERPSLHDEAAQMLRLAEGIPE
ncbi:MAG: lipopolysaccharide core heptose(I) kinase RfaP [Pseudohongiellaceae bacterium]